MQMFALCVVLQLVSHHASAGDVYEGDSVLLPCEFATFDMDPTPSVLWSRHDLRPSTVHQRRQEGDALEEQNRLYSGRTSMATDALKTGDLSLRLTELKASDSGTYTCSIASVGGEHRITHVPLQVTERFPSWAKGLLGVFTPLLVVVVGLVVLFHPYIISVYQVVVESGVESVQLPCKTMRYLSRVAKAEWKNPRNATVQVYRVGSDPTGHQHQHRQTEMKVNPLRCGDFSLTLRHPTSDDRGIWTCSVSSRDGQSLEKGVHLQVKVPKVVVDPGAELVLLPFGTTLSAGVTVTWTIGTKLVCHSGSDQPEEQHWLYHHRTEMRPRDFSLTLRNPTDVDSHTFTCTASRGGTILRKKEVQLQVKVCQVEVVDGDASVLLPFRTTGNLPEDVVVEWRRDDLGCPVHKHHSGADRPDEQDPRYTGRTKMEADPLRSGDVSLTLMHPRVRDTGTYVCVVDNATIQRKATVVLQVQGPAGRSRRRVAGAALL